MVPWERGLACDWREYIFWSHPWELSFHLGFQGPPWQDTEPSHCAPQLTKLPRCNPQLISWKSSAGQSPCCATSVPSWPITALKSLEHQSPGSSSANWLEPEGCGHCWLRLWVQRRRKDRTWHSAHGATSPWYHAGTSIYQHLFVMTSWANRRTFVSWVRGCSFSVDFGF